MITDQRVHMIVRRTLNPLIGQDGKRYIPRVAAARLPWLKRAFTRRRAARAGFGIVVILFMMLGASTPIHDATTERMVAVETRLTAAPL